MSIEMNVRPMTQTERMYSYTQSSQIQGLTGCIGHLRADMDSDGKGFYSTWDNHRAYLKTDAFRNEFDAVINALRFDAGYGGMLKDRNSLRRYCSARPGSSFGEDRDEYGFRADTKDYTYMLRLNPGKGVYNMYCYCYRRDWLEQHMRNAERGVRFIDTGYNTLFRVPDGGRIRVTYNDGETGEKTVRYIDDYHMEMSGGAGSLFHICEFAERTQESDVRVEPLDVMPEPETKQKTYAERGAER